MLQRSVPAHAPDDSGDELNLRDLWRALVRNRWLILAVTALVATLAAAYTATQPPVYQAEATLRIDESDAGKNLLGNLAPLARTPGKVETEMLVLRSRTIAEAVVDSLDLTLQLVEPAKPRNEVFSVLVVPADAPVGLFELKRQPGGDYSLAVQSSPPGRRVAVPARVRPGQAFRVGSAELALSPRLSRGGPDRIRFSITAFRETVEGVRHSIAVFRPEMMAQVVGVRFTSTDAELAAAVPNAVVNNFIRFKTQGSKTQQRSTVNFLRDQVATYADELRRAENELRGFRERERVVSPREEATEQVRRLAELQAERDRLRSEREALANLLAQVQAPRAGASTAEYRQLASFPVFLGNRAVQDLLQALTAIENQRATAIVGRTEEHLDVESLDARKRELELDLYRIARNYLDGLDSQIASTGELLGRFSGELSTIPAREVEFARLSRNQTLLSELYTLLQTRLKEAEILEAVEPSDVRVIDSALVPTVPIAPRPVRNVGVGFLLGLLLGVAAAVARQLLDTKVRTREDVQLATAGIPVIGTIPRIAAEAAAGNGRRLRLRAAPAAALSNRLVSQAHPASAPSEAFRALRTNITFSGAGEPPQLLVVTSAMPGEGKSTSSANLAVTLAQQGTRTLLIDGDLRRGILHHMFELPQNPGLTHVLVGHATAEEAAHRVPAAGGDEIPLYLMPTGVYPPNPAELLGAPRMARLLAELREKFDAVVIDAPPLNLVTDAAILASLADSTLLVTRVNHSDKRALHHAMGQLAQVSASITGVILNGIEANSSYYGSGYGYGYGHAPNGNGNGARELARRG